MCKLSVNINKFATLRNARGGNNPNVLQVALDCESFGAQGITVHPRPDERHIRYQDVLDLKPHLKTEFNIEGYPSPDFLDLVKKAQPAQVTLVPDPPGVLTSNAGWNTPKYKDFLKEVVSDLKAEGCRVSLFLDPQPDWVQAAAETGADRIELYTESYALAYTQNREAAVAPYRLTAQRAQACGLGVNAGHDLDLHNLQYLAEQIPFLAEVSIGHALVCDALYLGLHNTIQMYRAKLLTASESH
ncbi:MAG: pyridoxine 5'-phosphate synthase [Bacteroidia bacterium]